MGSIGRILRLREVLRITGLSRSSVYRLADAGTFPARVQIAPRAVGWREEEVLRWLEDRPDKAS